MRWKAKDYTTWHSYFVWWPKRLNGEWIWLERVLRRGREQLMQASKNSRYRWEFVGSEFDLIKMAEKEKAYAEDSVQASSPAGSAPINRLAQKAAITGLIPKGR